MQEIDADNFHLATISPITVWSRSVIVFHPLSAKLPHFF